MKLPLKELTVSAPMNKLFSLVFFFLFGRSLFGQDKELQKDSRDVLSRSFEKGFKEKYSGREFHYDIPESESQHFLRRFLEWFFNKLGNIFGFDISTQTLEFIEKAIYVILVFLALYFIVRLLMGREFSTFFSSEKKTAPTFSFHEEHIEDIDLDQMIKDALQNKDYRLAIRFMYLKTLKLLSLNNLIDWNPEKTNDDYLSELKENDFKEGFQKVSYWYDHIWYGEFIPDENGFERALKDFTQLNQKITNHG